MPLRFETFSREEVRAVEWTRRSPSRGGAVTLVHKSKSGFTVVSMVSRRESDWWARLERNGGDHIWHLFRERPPSEKHCKNEKDKKWRVSSLLILFVLLSDVPLSS